MKKTIFNKPGRRSQLGFSLAELSVYLAIVTILSVLALAGFKDYVISGRVSEAASEIQRAGARLEMNSDGQGTTPYANLTTAQVCNIMNGDSVIQTVGNGTGATCTHDLVAFTSGAVIGAPGTVNTAGDSWQIELDGVSSFACPDLAATMAKSASIITINGTTVLSPTTNNGRFDAGAANSACTLLDTNTFAFTGL
ncbi:MAG: fimbrial protein [Burkholderiaceae bacterium]|nr:MAG: fimbrial protein [Burkholderiaceae bacterium]